MLTRRISVLAASILSLVAITAGGLSASPAEEEFAQAAHLTSIGAFEDSVPHWKKARALFKDAKDSAHQVEAAIHLASAYYALGQTRLAADTLVAAQNLVLPNDKKHLAEIKAALGAIYTLAVPSMKEHAHHGKMVSAGGYCRDNFEGEYRSRACSERSACRSDRPDEFGESLQLSGKA